jgi:hypothetical protein
MKKTCYGLNFGAASDDIPAGYAQEVSYVGNPSSFTNLIAMKFSSGHQCTVKTLESGIVLLQSVDRTRGGLNQHHYSTREIGHRWPECRVGCYLLIGEVFRDCTGGNSL